MASSLWSFHCCSGLQWHMQLLMKSMVRREEMIAASGTVGETEAAQAGIAYLYGWSVMSALSSRQAQESFLEAHSAHFPPAQHVPVPRQCFWFCTALGSCPEPALRLSLMSVQLGAMLCWPNFWALTCSDQEWARKPSTLAGLWGLAPKPLRRVLGGMAADQEAIVLGTVQTRSARWSFPKEDLDAWLRSLNGICASEFLWQLLKSQPLFFIGQNPGLCFSRSYVIHILTVMVLWTRAELCWENNVILSDAGAEKIQPLHLQVNIEDSARREQTCPVGYPTPEYFHLPVNGNYYSIGIYVINQHFLTKPILPVGAFWIPPNPLRQLMSQLCRELVLCSPLAPNTHSLFFFFP